MWNHDDTRKGVLSAVRLLCLLALGCGNGGGSDSSSQAAPAARYLGNYHDFVKRSGISWKDDIPSLVQSLKDTGQNFYGYNAYDGNTTDPTAGHFWPQFLELLQETEGTGIDIFAVAPPPHTTYSVNRWGVDANSSINDWKTAWIAAATEFSTLSVQYPHLAGFTIDDFGNTY